MRRPCVRPLAGRRPAARGGVVAAPLPGTVMTTSAIITFVLIAGLVWGGFVFIITKAIRKESRKTDRG
jgi:hypothetical protein